MDGRGAAEDEERLQQKNCDQQSPFLARIWNQVFNPRLSALFCRLAVKLVEQVCLSSLVLDLYSRAYSFSVKYSPGSATLSPWTCVSETAAVLVKQDCGGGRLLQFQWMNLFPMTVFFV